MDTCWVVWCSYLGGNPSWRVFGLVLGNHCAFVRRDCRDQTVALGPGANVAECRSTMPVFGGNRTRDQAAYIKSTVSLATNLYGVGIYHIQSSSLGASKTQVWLEKRKTSLNIIRIENSSLFAASINPPVDVKTYGTVSHTAFQTYQALSCGTSRSGITQCTRETMAFSFPRGNNSLRLPLHRTSDCHDFRRAKPRDFVKQRGRSCACDSRMTWSYLFARAAGHGTEVFSCMTRFTLMCLDDDSREIQRYDFLSELSHQEFFDESIAGN